MTIYVIVAKILFLLINENDSTDRNLALHRGCVVSLGMNVMKSKNERN